MHTLPFSVEPTNILTMNERRNCLRELDAVEKLSSVLSYTRPWNEYVWHTRNVLSQMSSTNDL